MLKSLISWPFICVSLFWFGFGAFASALDEPNPQYGPKIMFVIITVLIYVRVLYD